MLTAALIVIAPNWQQPTYLSTVKLQYTHTMECYLASKKEYIIDTHDNLNETQWNCAQWEKKKDSP